MRDAAGTIKPMAAVNCIVNPHMSRAMVAILASIVLQKPHFLPTNKPKVAISPKTPKKKKHREKYSGRCVGYGGV
ncbi:MAG: hypothetical protein QXY40_09090 [Candidatus Methanomethylicia archaeon]